MNDNNCIAHEVLHLIKHKTKGKKGAGILKINLSKAYGKISGKFLRTSPLSLWFSYSLGQLDHAMCHYSVLLSPGQWCTHRLLLPKSRPKTE